MKSLSEKSTEKIHDFLGLEMKPGDIFLMAGEFGLVPHLLVALCVAKDRFSPGPSVASVYYGKNSSGGKVIINSNTPFPEAFRNRAILIEHPEWFVGDSRFKDILAARYRFLDNQEGFVKENFGLYIQGLILWDRKADR